MSTMFPSMISDEPPPLGSSDEEDNDDYIEFRTGGLKLDIQDPSPTCSPRKPPIRSSSNDSESSSQLSVSNIDFPNSSAHGNNYESEPGIQKIEQKVEPEVDATEEENLTDNTSPAISNGDRIPCQPQRPLEDGSMSSTSNYTKPCTTSENADSTLPKEPDRFQSSEEVTLFVSCSPETTTHSLVLTREANDAAVVNEAEFCHGEHETNETVSLEVEADGVDSLDCARRRESSSTLSSDVNPAQEYIPSATLQTHFAHDELHDEFQEFDSAEPKRFDAVEPQQEEFTTTDRSASSDVPGGSTLEALNFEDSLPTNLEGTDPKTELREDGFGFIAAVLPQACDPRDLVDDDWRPFEDAAANSLTVPIPATDFDDDDFGDFTSSEHTNTLPIGATQVPSANTLVEDRFEVIIKSLFAQVVQPASSDLLPFRSIDSELKNGTSNKTWNHVEEFEDSYGLVFKWANSGVYQHLLKSLNVDPTTILYSGKWGPFEVPKFAASLVDTPLQPQASFKPSSQAETEDFYQNPPKHNSPASSSQSPGEESSNSGFGEPEDKVEIKMSTESIKILEQLPDLSYMRAKTLVFPRNPKY